MYPWLQSAVADFYQQYLQADRVPHALLLQARRGIGAPELAELLAQMLLCWQPGAGGGCGVCRACTLMSHRTHPDLLELSAAVKGNTEAAETANKERIRELQQDLDLSSHLGGRKLCILDAAEAMSGEVSNALLKTLEEPQPNRHILLVNEGRANLLATIESRCVKLHCPSPDTGIALAWLQQRQSSAGAELNPQRTLEYLQLADNAPLTVLDWLEDEEQLQRCFEVLAELSRPAGAEPLALAPELYALEPEQLFAWLNAHLGRTIRARALEPTSQPPLDLRAALELHSYWQEAERLHRVHNLDIKLLVDRFVVSWRQLWLA